MNEIIFTMLSYFLLFAFTVHFVTNECVVAKYGHVFNQSEIILC